MPRGPTIKSAAPAWRHLAAAAALASPPPPRASSSSLSPSSPPLDAEEEITTTGIARRFLRSAARKRRADARGGACSLSTRSYPAFSCCLEARTCSALELVETARAC